MTPCERGMGLSITSIEENVTTKAEATCATLKVNLAWAGGRTHC